MDAAEVRFWESEWVGPNGNLGQVGVTHPCSPEVGHAPRNPALLRSLQEIKHALQNGQLDASKVTVVPHEKRADIWFLRFTNLGGGWQGAEIVAWLTFDYYSRTDKRQKTLFNFPDHPPLFGVLTPTKVFSDLTGSKWVCLPGLATGLGPEKVAWRAAYTGSAVAGDSGYTSVVTEDMVTVTKTSGTGHFKKGIALPKLHGSMVGYVQMLLSMFDPPVGCASGWFEMEAMDGIAKPSVLATYRDNGTLDNFKQNSHTC
jgi:hypothetical protein